MTRECVVSSVAVWADRSASPLRVQVEEDEFGEVFAYGAELEVDRGGGEDTGNGEGDDAVHQVAR